MPLIRQRVQHGFVSVLALLFIVLVVVFVLMQTLSMSGSKALEAAQYSDGLKALAAAESGREAALAGITSAINLDDTTFTSSCAAYAGSASPTSVGNGQSFSYIATGTPSTASLCAVRVQGHAGQASRTLEHWINFSSVVGTGNYGTDITMTLHNPYSVPAVAVFDLAWRRHGSTGSSPPGGQSDASICTLPSCGLQWNLESSSGTPSVGSMGTSVGVAANTSVQVTQTLSAVRNYTEVGLILGGYGSPPVLKGSYSDSQQTVNTSNQAVSSGTTTSGEAKGWCAGADTLVFGVSGRGNDDYTAAFSNVNFNTAGNPAQPIPMKWVVHYPNTDGTSPNTFGDVFAEVWYTYNPYVKLQGASSSGTTVTANSTSGLQPGTLLKVYSGTGQFQGFTHVASVVDGTHFTVDKAPSTPLSNATVCGGICALFDNPSSNGAKTTTFSLTRSSSAAQQWAGGFACFSGVDPNKVRRVSTSSVRIQRWHEVVSGE